MEDFTLREITGIVLCMDFPKKTPQQLLKNITAAFLTEEPSIIRYLLQSFKDWVKLVFLELYGRSTSGYQQPMAFCRRLLERINNDPNPILFHLYYGLIELFLPGTELQTFKTCTIILRHSQTTPMQQSVEDFNFFLSMYEEESAMVSYWNCMKSIIPSMYMFVATF